MFLLLHVPRWPERHHCTNLYRNNNELFMNSALFSKFLLTGAYTFNDNYLMTSKWRLQECGFSQARFSTDPAGEAEEAVKTLYNFGEEKPLSVTASSTWDACFLYAELLTQKTWNLSLGRWQGLLEKVERELVAGDMVKEIMELGGNVLFRTMKKKLIMRDETMNKVSVLEGPSAYVRSSHLVGDKYCVLFDDGSVHFTPVDSDPLHGHPYLLGWMVKDVACGSDHILLLEEGRGRVWSLGLNHRGQLGHGDLHQRTEPSLIEALDGLKITAVSCGLWHNLVLSEYGDLYSWGWNTHKQLGHSSNSPTIAVPCLVEVDEADEFCCVSCGSRHSAALTVCGKLLTWGWNGYGQLGHSDQAGPAVVHVPRDAVVSWMYCGPWNTLFILKSEA